ncbi:MAG TPA: ABC-F family ATP-binding cassette domain-containing protein, partial [Cytophagaceae bacterium]
TSDHAALSAAMEKMDAAGAWDYEAKAKQITSQLGLMNMHQSITGLSGGQRKRLALAKVMLEEPDLIIMDEPTNHLDLDSIEWLEDTLASKNTSLLLVTHDRYFLDKVTNEIIELENGSISRYQGNYSYYLERKAEKVQQLQAENEKAQNLMRKELDWIRRQPKARGTKAKYRIDAFHELKEKAAPIKTTQKLELNVKETRLGNKILEVDHISKGYNGNTLIKDFSYIFKKKDRIGIVGKNGAGKSTFLNMLTGNLKPDQGSVIKGDTTVFGYFTQEGLDISEDKRVIDVVKEIAEVITLGNGQTLGVSQFLTLFLFPPPMQYTYISKLSGGEKKRLQLLKVLVKNPNFLILDEPTNDLDIQTLNVLEDFLQNFGGCLLIVSHDRYFMDTLVDHLFVFEDNGQIKDFPGNYTDYREYIKEKLQEEKKEKQQEKQEQQAIPTPAKENKKATFKEKKEYEQLEKEIEALEKTKEEIINKLNSGTGSHEELTEWSKEIERLISLIDEKSERWLELAEKIQ